MFTDISTGFVLHTVCMGWCLHVCCLFVVEQKSNKDEYYMQSNLYDFCLYHVCHIIYTSCNARLLHVTCQTQRTISFLSFLNFILL